MPSIPPGPAMEPAPSSLAGRIRAGAPKNRKSREQPQEANRGSWAPGETGRKGIPAGQRSLWAHASRDRREEFQFSREFSCPACAAPLRMLATGGWQCWGCTTSITPLSVRRRVIKLWAEGPSSAKIGEVVGLSKCAVLGLVRRMGLPRRPSPIGSGRPPSPAAAAKPARKERRFFIQPKKTQPLPVFKEPKLPPCVAAAQSAAPGGSADVAENAPAEPKGGFVRGFYTHCQYLTGERRFCGDPSQIHSNYCPTHHRRCFLKAA